jgi:hypothetical protein
VAPAFQSTNLVLDGSLLGTQGSVRLPFPLLALQKGTGDVPAHVVLVTNTSQCAIVL